jgi:hypothetical protein
VIGLKMAGAFAAATFSSNRDNWLPAPPRRLCFAKENLALSLFGFSSKKLL